jgi:hypothetical protein
MPKEVSDVEEEKDPAWKKIRCPFYSPFDSAQLREAPRNLTEMS